MTTCRNCGNAVPVGGSRCPRCGARYEGQNESKPKTPQWGGLDLDTAHDRTVKSEYVADPVSPKPAERLTDASEPSSGIFTQKQRSMRSSVDIDMGNTQSTVFDDPLSGFSKDDVELQLDLDATKRSFDQKAAREKAQREATEDTENEARKIEAIAKYGRPPANHFAAVIYAGRVLWRQYRLRSDLHNLAKNARQARERLQKSLSAIGAAMYGRRDRSELQRYRDQIQAITDAERAIQDLRESHQQVRASSVEVMHDVMQTIKDIQLRTEPLRLEEAELLEELTQVDKVRVKHETLIAHAEAEHKALTQNAASKLDPSVVAAFDRERKRRQEKLDIVLDRISGINSKIDGVRARLQEAKEEIESLHQRRKSLHVDRAQNEQRHEKRNSDAQNAYERAQTALGECGLIDDLKEIAQGEIVKARAAKEQLERIEQRTALYEKAKAAYDRSAFTRGLYLVGALTGLVIVALVAVSHLVADSDAADLGVDEVTQEQIRP